MKVLFLANTWAQYINAITLAKTEFSESVCDLFYADGLKPIIEAQKEKVFNATYFRPTLKKHFSGTKFGQLWNWIEAGITYKRLLKKFPTDPKQYNRICIPGIALDYYLIYYAAHSANRDIKLSLYEEGICEYYILGNRNRKKELYSKIFFGCYCYEECDSLYVHCPEAVINLWDNINVHKLMSPIKVPNMPRLINSVFNYETDNKVFIKKYVFVDQAYYGLQNQEEKENEQLELFNTLKNTVGDDNILIKLHPKSPDVKYGAQYTYIKEKVPMELIAMNESVKDMIFISVISSAIINFKLSLGLEPSVIILQKILDVKHNTQYLRSDSVFFKVKEMYQNDKFFIPSTESEFIEILRTY